MPMGKTKLALLMLVLAPLLVTCHQAILTAPPGSTLTLIPNPEFIAAHGGISVIAALVIEPAGTPVPDGTVVQFFTTLGRIDEQGKTNDGVARVNLVGDSRSGTARVLAVSGGPAVQPTGSPSPGTGGGTASGSGSASTTVLIGNINAAGCILTADPPRLTISRSTHVVATVFDANGNFVANVPVFFSVSSPANEFFDVQGPAFTDQNGRAENVMRTRRAGPVSTTVTVRAQALAENGTIECTTDVGVVF
jgi:hypothetical protein